MKLPHKLVVTGSGSLELKQKLHESLVGRKQVFELTTLTFKEFVNHKTNYKYQKQLPQFFSIETDLTNHLLNEYLGFGGYPRVVLAETIAQKTDLINEIHQSYLLKDISHLLNVQKLDSFSNLVKILASQIGQLTNYTELSNTLNLSTKTIKKFLWYLEHTFIIHRLSPFFKNTRKEITKSPVYYFTDLGLRNFVINNFTQDPNLPDGFLFQNFVYHLLKSTQPLNSQLHYWRTKDKTEVDFVSIDAKNITPYEVKFSNLKQTTIPRSLRSFIKKYHPKKAWVINLSLQKTIKLNQTKVKFSPCSSLLT